MIQDNPFCNITVLIFKDSFKYVKEIKLLSNNPGQPPGQLTSQRYKQETVSGAIRLDL